jgi:hypothetical protein
VVHARKLFILNFTSHHATELVFNQEICFSYACKMLHSVGPRLCHFSNAPKNAKIVDAELHLALNSPYAFGDDSLLCYESMPSHEEINQI